MLTNLLLPLFVALTPMNDAAPEKKPTPPPGPDPTFLRDSAETRGYLLGRPSQVKPMPDGKSVLFLRSPPRDPSLRLYEFVLATGETRELVTPEQILNGAAEELSVAEKARRERQRITTRGFTSFQVSEDGKRILVPLSGKLYAVEREGGKVRTVYGGQAAILDPRLSPDGTQVGYVKENDVFVADVVSGKERRVTRGGSEDRPHGLAEFVAQEEMDRFEGYWWAPDGKSIAYAEVDQKGVERFAIADPAKPEKIPEAFPYPRPGKPNATVKLGVIAVGGGKTVWAKWDDAKYPYLARVSWKKGSPLTLLVQARDQREEALVTVDVKSGATRILHVEKDEAWLNLDRGLPRWLPDGSGFLFVSERSGRRELELHKPSGELDRVLVPGKLGFLSLAHLGHESKELFVTCTPSTIGTQLFRVPLTSGEPVALTPDDGVEHTAVVAEDGSFFVDTITRRDAMAVVEVVKADGTKLGTLPSVTDTPKFRAVPEIFTVEGSAERNGKRLSYFAAVLRPRGFDPARKYPVIVSVYGGPHHNVIVPDERQFLMSQWFADHGAIVVSFDNRGTPRRDREWERAIRGSFGTIPLEDQVDALKALGAKLKELDLARVGIYGWSFGGYLSALAVLRRPDVFKVGVAGAPVVDWKDYDTHYTERYLGLPADNEKGYQESSLLTWAPKLERPLLLIHGTADDNVYFFHSLKLADALFKAGKDVDVLPLVGFTHMVADVVVRERLYGKVARYLMEHLQEPPAAPRK